jgi:DNA-binding transcriptional MerR regulator
LPQAGRIAINRVTELTYGATNVIKAVGSNSDATNRQLAAKPQLHTVTQLAAELGITARTLRFYEGKGLITPSRLGTTRVYMARDRARMILILRGKRLGFSLREIAEYLDLYDTDPTQKTQNARLLKLVTARMNKLEQQRTALEEMLVELQNLKRHAESVLGDASMPSPPKAKS